MFWVVKFKKKVRSFICRGNGWWNRAWSCPHNKLGVWRQLTLCHPTQARIHRNRSNLIGLSSACFRPYIGKNQRAKTVPCINLLLAWTHICNQFHLYEFRTLSWHPCIAISLECETLPSTSYLQLSLQVFTSQDLHFNSKIGGPKFLVQCWERERESSDCLQLLYLESVVEGLVN